MPPFVVFSLPRSRSAWTKHWLGEAAAAPVGHDLAIEADTIDGWLETLVRRVRGTCETGAVEVWPILRRALPRSRIVTVRRDLSEVIASLISLGLEPRLADLEHRAAALAKLAEQPGVLAVEYDDLRDPRVCARVQEHCLGMPFNWPVWDRMDRINIQLDIPARVARLVARREPIAALKVELATRLACPAAFVTVGEERWTDAGAEFEALGAMHHPEATEGREGPYELKTGVIEAMDAAGLWRMFVARVDSIMVGYCLWTRQTNAESAAPITMMHGPFYVMPQCARYHLGRRLLEVSRAAFAAEGIEMLHLHHTVYGRGARAGRLYERMGAIEHQREYRLAVKD